jgi:hypothetical protein
MRWITVLCLWAGTGIFIAIGIDQNEPEFWSSHLKLYQVCMPFSFFFVSESRCFMYWCTNKLKTELPFGLFVDDQVHSPLWFEKLEWKERLCAEKKKAAEAEIDRDMSIMWCSVTCEWKRLRSLGGLGLMAVWFLVSVHDDFGRCL